MSIRIYTRSDLIERYQGISIYDIDSNHLRSSALESCVHDNMVLFFDANNLMYKILKSRLPDIPRGFVATKAFYAECGIFEDLLQDLSPAIFKNMTSFEMIMQHSKFAKSTCIVYYSNIHIDDVVKLIRHRVGDCNMTITQNSISLMIPGGKNKIVFVSDVVPKESTIGYNFLYDIRETDLLLGKGYMYEY